MAEWESYKKFVSRREFKRMIVVGRIAAAVALPVIVIGGTSSTGEAAPADSEDNVMQVGATSTPIPGATRTPTPHHEVLAADALTKIAANEPYIGIAVQKGTDAQERSLYLSTRVAELENRDFVQQEQVKDLESKHSRSLVLVAVLGGIVLGSAMAKRHEMMKTSTRRLFRRALRRGI